MVFLLATIVLALALVPITKGSFHRLGAVHFRLMWLLLVALAIQIALEYVDFPKDKIETIGLAILLASYAMIFGFCFANRMVKGVGIIAFGIALNVVVIALNQGMPAKDDVVTRNGHQVHVPIEQTVKHRPQEDDDLLPFLSDVITLPRLPNQQFSVGDIVISLGIIDLCFEASRVPAGAVRRFRSRLRASRRAGLVGRERLRVRRSHRRRTGIREPSRAPRGQDRRARAGLLTARRTHSQPSGSGPT